MEEHLRGCPECTAEVESLTRPLGLFRASVVALGEQRMGPMRFVAPERVARPLRWRIAMAAAAALAVAAIPVVRHFQPVPQITSPVMIAQVSDDVLLRQVEKEITRSVPATMEPLEKLMSGDDNRRAE